MSDSYDHCFQPDTIVKQLTYILDFLDNNYHNFPNKKIYTEIVSELSLCLKDKHNINILPYLYILRRYHNSSECLPLLIETYYKMCQTRTRNNHFDSHLC